MIVALDVCYKDDGKALVGAIAFDSYDSALALAQWTIEVEDAPAYESGAFSLRELPCLIAALAASPVDIHAIIVDAYVDLDEAGRAGLGRKLFDALGQSIPVIGVAKTRFAGSPASWELLRGESSRPLHVTAAGMTHAQAKAHVASMAGSHRLPIMLSLVDGLGRGRAIPPASSARRPGP